MVYACVYVYRHAYVGPGSKHYISSVPHYHIFYSYFVYGHTCMHMQTCMPANMYYTTLHCRSEDNCRSQISYYVGSGDWTEVISFGCKHLKIESSHQPHPIVFNGFSLNLKLADWARLADQWASRIILFLSSRGYRCALPSPVFILVVHTQFLMLDLWNHIPSPIIMSF